MTEVLDALKIREAPVAPPACASCGQQKPDDRHVDFSASWDGPVLNANDVIRNGTAPVAIDDLVLCEECVRAGAMVLGMADQDQALSDKLQAQLSEQAERILGLDAYVRKLEDAIASKPQARAKA